MQSSKNNSWRKLRQKLVMIASGLFFISCCFLLTFCQNSENRAENEEAQAPEQASLAFLNHDPNVKYTGIKSCVSCHQEIHEGFMHTGHGKSFYLPDKNNIIEDFTKATVYDSFSNLGYRAFWKGNDMWISEFRTRGRDTIFYRQEKVDYVIGSGNQTRSYLYEHKGYFYEMPITWYVGKGVWDLSPGYEKGGNSGFRRTIGRQCMDCHNSDYEFVQNSVNKFTSVGLGMSCEKCHGPGEAHVEAMMAGKTVAEGEIDRTIVNPAKLPIQLQFDVCRQCHLEGVTVPKQGKDPLNFRPGMALAEFWDVFLPVAEDQSQFGFASHAERLQQSPCFIQSGQKLTCNTCHTPHQTLKANATEFYTQKCQSCHAPATFDENHESLNIKDQDCVKCHMPKSGTTDIPHVSSTDHYIRVVKEMEQTSLKRSDKLVTFRSFTSDKNINPHDREHVLANMIYFEQHEQDPAYLQRVSQYVDQLELEKQVKFAYLNNSNPPANLSSLQPQQVQNPYTLFYIGQILKRQGQPHLSWLELSVQKAPANQDFLYFLGKAYDDAGRVAEAVATYKNVLQLNPYYKEALVNLGFLYLMQQNFEQALQLTERAIKADPNYQLAYENRINIYLQQGQYQKGLNLLDELIKLYPNNPQYPQLRNQVKQML